MKILEQGMDNDSWVDIIEDKIAQESLIIASNRTEVLNKLQQAIEATESEFPKARLTIEDGLTNRLEQNELSKEQILEEMRSQLKARRKADKAAGRTTFGVHRSEFLVTHAENNQLAKFCSTGQQKALLITIILAQVNSIIRETGIRPILLLDEVFVHLDDRRKKYLSEFFIESKMQLWVTATDLTGIKDLADLSNVVDL
jgi:DNA replication and repair protein RecF